MKEECLICDGLLEYLEKDELMECAICHKKENSKTRCVNGHYVCNECHTQGMDSIVKICLDETSDDPVEIVNKLMSQPFCHMHGPEHHVMVGSALLTAYKNAGGDIGAGMSSGMFVSIISKSTPLANESFALSHKMTAMALGKIGEVGGPRCCKRDSFLSILAAVDFVKEHFGIAMRKSKVTCHYSQKNNQCIGKRCPFSKGGNLYGK